MSDERKQAFALEDDESELVANDNDVFEFADDGDDDDDDDDQRANHAKLQDTQWIDELRSALERGCDLGSIRNIGKCRPLTNDLRLSVWKVSEHETLTRRESRRCRSRHVWILMRITILRNTSIVMFSIYLNRVFFEKMCCA